MPHAQEPSDTRPLVTHFLYAYRQEATIRAAIEGVLAQTYQPLEIVLSDDCSPDGTFGIMQEMAAAYDGPHRIVLNRNPTNLGIAAHAERIMEISSGAFIVESAGDDISRPERVERLVEAWLATGRRARAVHSEKQDIDADGNLLPLAPRSDILANITPLEKLRGYHDLIGATMGWSREVYDRFGPISDIAPFHDYPIAFRALLLGGVEFLPEPLVLYRRGGVSAGGAARRPSETCGYRYFYGERIRYMRWDIDYYRRYLRDMETVPPPDAAICRETAQRWLREAQHTVALADMSHTRRLAALPGSARMSLKYSTPYFVKNNTKYILDRLFIGHLNLRKDIHTRLATRRDTGRLVSQARNG